MSQVQTGFDPRLQQDPPAQSRTSPALLWLLLLLVIAFALWWLRQERPAAAEPAPLPAAATTALPAPIDEPLAAAAPARKPARATERTVVRYRAPSLIASSRIMPKYPASALRAGETGVVTVAATIGTDGVPVEVGIDDRSGNRELDRAAVAAVKQWRFQPAMRNGKAVQGTVRVPVQFALDRG
jgi:protein TonB